MCILTGVIGSEGGYLRQSMALGIPNPLLNNRGILRAQLLPRGISYAVQNAPQKDVSYSLSYEDYLYLKRHKVEGQDSPFNPDPTEPGPAIADIIDKYDHIKHDTQRSDAELKQSAATSSRLVNRCHNILVSNAVVPEVHKHVYFHVPPPEFEDTPTAPRIFQPTKKNVNILFIKVPSYEPTRLSLQQLLRSQQALIEDKTLIYVLSKKENISQPVVLPPKPSAPEVYFVKYKTPNDIESTNNVLSLPTLLQNVSPVLEPRRAAHDPWKVDLQ